MQLLLVKDVLKLGHVGDVVGVNQKLLSLLMSAGHVPVLACLAADQTANLLNINADIVANQTAHALGADHLMLVTGVPGVLLDLADPSSRIPTMTIEQARAAIDNGIVSGGMIPKLEESMRVLGDGRVGSIHIVGKLTAGQLLAEIDAPGTVGTALLQ